MTQESIIRSAMACFKLLLLLLLLLLFWN